MKVAGIFTLTVIQECQGVIILIQNRIVQKRFFNCQEIVQFVNFFGVLGKFSEFQSFKYFEISFKISKVTTKVQFFLLQISLLKKISQGFFLAL